MTDCIRSQKTRILSVNKNKNSRIKSYNRIKKKSCRKTVKDFAIFYKKNARYCSLPLEAQGTGSNSVSYAKPQYEMICGWSYKNDHFTHSRNLKFCLNHIGKTRENPRKRKHIKLVTNYIKGKEQTKFSYNGSTQIDSEDGNSFWIYTIERDKYNSKTRY